MCVVSLDKSAGIPAVEMGVFAELLAREAGSVSLLAWHRPCLSKCLSGIMKLLSEGFFKTVVAL